MFFHSIIFVEISNHVFKKTRDYNWDIKKAFYPDLDKFAYF